MGMKSISKEKHTRVPDDDDALFVEREHTKGMKHNNTKEKEGEWKERIHRRRERV